MCHRIPVGTRLLVKKADLSEGAPSKPLVQTLVGGKAPKLAYKRCQDARTAEAEFICYNGITCNFVDSEAWCVMMQVVASAGLAYKPVSRKPLATTELQNEGDYMNRDVNRLLETTKLYGYRIKSDRWTDVYETHATHLFSSCIIHVQN